MSQETIKECPVKLFIKFIEIHGYKEARQRGSHKIFIKPNSFRSLTIPCHGIIRKNKPVLKPGVIKSNLRSMNISNEDWLDFYNKYK
jgi:predicted RNA binding protein YcfA (HicA-like mRNA interferase family)